MSFFKYVWNSSHINRLKNIKDKNWKLKTETTSLKLVFWVGKHFVDNEHGVLTSGYSMDISMRIQSKTRATWYLEWILVTPIWLQQEFKRKCSTTLNCINEYEAMKTPPRVKRAMWNLLLFESPTSTSLSVT